MKLEPCTIAEANEFVGKHHRHSRPTVGGRFAVRLIGSRGIIGVAIVGRPVARLLDARHTAEITRLCVVPESPLGACSKLYSACWRAWREMGGERMITYTLQQESGASLRGAGWRCVAESGKSQWDRPSRSRERRQIYSEPKWRWEKSIPAAELNRRHDARQKEQ